MKLIRLSMMCVGTLALFHTYYETSTIGYLIAAIFCSVLTINVINKELES